MRMGVCVTLCVRVSLFCGPHCNSFKPHAVLWGEHRRRDVIGLTVLLYSKIVRNNSYMWVCSKNPIESLSLAVWECL